MKISLSLLSLCTALGLAGPTYGSDSKLVLTGGYFSFDAVVNNRKTTVSNPSAFRVGYEKSLLPKLDLAIGYTVLLPQFSPSDLGYGLDLGVHWFPITASNDQTYSSPNVKALSLSAFRPFIGTGFYQRQFQAVKSSFAGIGFVGGVERFYSEKLNLRIESRYLTLSGSTETKATELNLLFGIVYKL